MFIKLIERFAAYQLKKSLPKFVKGAVAGAMGLIGGLLLNAKVVAAQVALRKYGVDIEIDPATIQGGLTILFTGLGTAVINFFTHKGAETPPAE